MLIICKLIFLNDQNQEELQGNWKKEARNQKQLKNKEKAWSAKFRSLKWVAAKKISQPSGVAAKINFRCETISQPPNALCEKFCSCEETPWHTSAISQPSTPVSQLRNGCEISTPWNPPFRSRDAISKGVSQLRNHPLAHECHFVASYAHFSAGKWAAKMLLNLPFLRKSPHACCEKSRLLWKGTVTLGVPFKRYKFHFSYSKRSFELQKGTKMSQAKAPSCLPPPPEQAACTSGHFR